MDLDEEVNARIRANTEQACRYILPDGPKEAVMSLQTVNEQRRKINELLGRMRAREANLTREVDDGG